MVTNNEANSKKLRRFLKAGCRDKFTIKRHRVTSVKPCYYKELRINGIHITRESVQGTRKQDNGKVIALNRFDHYYHLDFIRFDSKKNLMKYMQILNHVKMYYPVNQVEVTPAMIRHAFISFKTYKYSEMNLTKHDVPDPKRCRHI